MTTLAEAAAEYLSQDDSFVAIDYLCRQSDLQESAKAYISLTNSLYWEKKDIDAVVMVSRAGIQHCLTSAAQAPEADKAQTLLSNAKEMAYNLGSFTWPGWDESGITLTSTHQRLGRDGARLNLRLAETLKKGPLPTARAHWLVGAQLMAAGEWNAARREFERAAEYATTSDSAAEELLAAGFAELCALLESPQDSQDTSVLDDIKARLAPIQPGFSAQIETAWRVFGCSQALG